MSCRLQLRCTDLAEILQTASTKARFTTSLLFYSAKSGECVAAYRSIQSMGSNPIQVAFKLRLIRIYFLLALSFV